MEGPEDQVKKTQAESNQQVLDDVTQPFQNPPLEAQEAGQPKDFPQNDEKQNPKNHVQVVKR